MPKIHPPQRSTLPVHTIETLKRVARTLEGCSLTIGNFDGVHVGHQAILRQVCGAERPNRKPSVALTFEPHPVRYFHPDKEPFRLTTPAQKVVLLRHYGVDRPLIVRFGSELSKLEAETFVRELILGAFSPSLVVVGYDFNFGRGRRGSPELLQEICREQGQPVVVQSPVSAAETVVSSTRIRKELRSGRVGLARRLLGRPFAVVGRVVHGKGRGRDLGFPTANLDVDNELLPTYGVYAAQLEVAGDWLPAVANIGVRPTFGGSVATVEAFVLENGEGAALDLYGEAAALHLLAHLRGEMRFASVEALVAQIERDVEVGRELLANDPGTDVIPQASAAGSHPQN